MARIQAALMLSILGVATPAWSQSPGLGPGQLRSASTVHSIGVEWLIIGDSNRNARGTLHYRVQGSTAWQVALPLVRVDYLGVNSLAGSVMFLNPATTYEVRVEILDPDGGSASQTLVVTTRREPTPPTGGRILHVVPGSSGGDGSAADPYRGFGTAWANARAGDIVLVHAGLYGAVAASGRPSGAPDNHIVFRAAGDGPAVLEWVDLRYVGYIWFDGLTFNNTRAPMPAAARDADDYTAIFASLLNAGYDTGYQSMAADVNGIVITRTRFNGYKHAVRGGPRTSGWFVTDNTIVGDRVLGMTSTPSFDGEGIELGDGDDHVVAYNSITLTADGISSPGRNCDIYGNDIFDVTDDGIELDGGTANTRAWGNRIHNAGHNGFSFQPQGGAPWYIVRNQVVNTQESIFKFREADRFVALHNTFVNWSWVLDHWSDQILGGITRNNLWISMTGPIWNRGSAEVDWRTDLDYDGFDWGASSYAFGYAGSNLPDLPSLRSATGQEVHGIRISHATCFETFDVPGPPPLTTIPPQWMTLQSACPAVDAGDVLANINDGYTGGAPDLGAYERGQPLPHYGPRPAADVMFVLTVSRAGTGGGTVSSNPAGIDCGPDCTEQYPSGTPVTLTAQAAAGSVFAGWTGAGCVGTAPCTVGMSGARAVTALFVSEASPAVTLLGAVLPSSRSVAMGQTATAFAAVINTGPGRGLTCGLQLATPIAAAFAYQTTNPQTNALTGTANTPVDIEMGALQTFVFALTPSAPLPPTDVALSMACANSAPAEIHQGLNTLLLSVSATPVPDVVAMAMTLSRDGIVTVTAPGAESVFSVATANVGLGATMTVTTDTGSIPLPVDVRLCRTQPATGACLGTPEVSVTTMLDGPGTATFGVFVRAVGPIPFQPALHRIHVRFRDGAGVVRGSTSVAVRTP